MFRVDEQAASPGFAMLLPYGKMRRPGTTPDELMVYHFHCRARSTVMEFERVHAPFLYSETKERKPQFMHLFRNDIYNRDPRVSFLSRAAAKDRHGNHQDPRCAVNASRFGASAGVDAAANHISDGNHPTSKNLWDNPERQAKIKTELYQYNIDGRESTWDVSCNFPHGEHELKFCYSTLVLMECSEQFTNAHTSLYRPCSTPVRTEAW